MPLAIQALLPLAVLLSAALIVRLRPRQPVNGWIAIVSTAAAAVIALTELIRLAPGEHVDVPYLTTFPYADLVIRLDGLSLAFATVTLLTAALLMLARERDRRDRRDPWTGWLLTSAAVSAVILAGNLLLLYLLLQVLTLAWSGALDETAPRRLRLRITLQIADIGLLLAAASAIQSVGTSSFSGVPSDTFGVATFWLMLLPVVVRVAALAGTAQRPMAAVLFGPAIAWVAPAGYVLLRLLALMGGRLPDRPTAVILFVGGALAAIGLGLAALGSAAPARATAPLLAAQAALALSLSSAGEPLATVACTWLWLLLIPLAGLACIRVGPGAPMDGLTRFQLSMLPASIAFTAVWLVALTLNARGLLVAILPLAVAVLVAAAAAGRGLPLPRRLPRSIAGVWGLAMLVIAAFPGPVMSGLVAPAASTARVVPAGTISTSPIGLSTPYGLWPALLVSLLVAGLLAFGGRMATAVPTVLSVSRLPGVIRGRGTLQLRPLVRRSSLASLLAGWWPRVVLWGAFAAVMVVAVVRP